MEDKDKTRVQLIDELTEMRARLAAMDRNCSDKNPERTEDENLPGNTERLRMVLEATEDGIWDWDIKTGQAYFSPRYYAMLGYDENEFPSSYESWRGLVHPDDVEAAESVIAQAVDAHTSFAVEFRMKAKNGAWCWILSRGKAFTLDADGRCIRMVGTHADIS